MNETMNVVVEVWPLAADEAGIWLLDRDAWRSAPIPADSEPHFEVELTMAEHGLHDVALLHSTSWRPDGPSVVLTYVAAVHVAGPVRAEWSAAEPVPADLLPVVGNPLPHGAAEAPVPRYIDVLHHAIRHLCFLADTDAAARQALVGYWPTYLEHLAPALAGMYEVAERAPGIPGRR